jgi:inosine/xanthosine triphosphatase
VNAARPISTHSAATVILRVGVGSANAAKVSAVRAVLRRLRAPYRLVVCPAPSGVSDQPKSDEEALQGAVHRAQGVLAATDVDLAIAFEGGVDRTLFGTFAVEWCAVHDRAGVQGLGGGPRVLLPSTIAERIQLGQPLSVALERSGVGRASPRGGIFGLLTRNVVTRESANREALVLALARFLEAPLYGDKSSSEIAALLGERLVDHFAGDRAPPRFGEQLSLRLH